MSLMLKIKQRISSFLGRHSVNGRGAFVLSYIHNRGMIPNLAHPKDLSEIWMKKVLDGYYNGFYNLADKYAVRQYVENKGLGHILVPLIGVYTNSDEIDLSVLPEKFAMKANYGSGKNIICQDKHVVNESELKSKVSRWLQNSTNSYTERHYNLIEKKIVCEEFIDDGTGGLPVDYKFMCFNGRVVCVLVCSNRSGDETDYLPYMPDWTPRYDYYRNVDKTLPLAVKPKNFENMVRVAELLSEGIDLVRVDLYSNGDRIWFGEITLTPAGCIFKRWTNRAMRNLGEVYAKMSK